MRNDFLAHANWKSHRYIEKVKLASGKYKYFYSLAEYQAYMKGKSKSENGTERKEGSAALKDPKQEALKAISKGTSAIEGLKANNFTASGTDAKSKEASLKNSIATGEKKIDEVLNKSSSSKSSDSSSSKKSGSSSGSSSKKSKGASSSKSSKSKKEATEKTAKSSSSKSAKEKTETTSKSTKKTTTKSETGGKVTLDSIKKMFDISDDKVNTHESASKMISEMESKYEDGAFGYLVSGDNTYKWAKNDGKITITDFNTGKEVSVDEYLKEAKDIKEFRTDKKSKKK